MLRFVLAALLAAHADQALAQDAPMGGIAPEERPSFLDPLDQADRDRGAAHTPASRRALMQFAGCVVERSPAEVHRVLTMDFSTRAYGRRLEKLARDNESCLRITGEEAMVMGNLPMAAALAETVLLADSTALNTRLAKAAAGPEAKTYSPVDAVATCIARSTPDDAARLFAAAPESEEEKAAASALAPVLSACVRLVGSPPIETDAFGLRSILATAAYRLLAAEQAG